MTDTIEMKVEQNQLYANEQILDASTSNGSAKLDSRVGEGTPTKKPQHNKPARTAVKER